MHIDKEKIPEYVGQALEVDLDDGFWFGDLKVKEQMFCQNYGGYRFDCAFRIGSRPTTENEMQKLIRVHLDVGFGDQTFATRATAMPRSFFQFASNLEPGIFKTAWKSVIVSGKKPSFESAWEVLLGHLKKLDKLNWTT